MNRTWKGWRGSGALMPGVAAFAAGMVLLAAGVRADDAAAPARAVRLSFVNGRVQVSQSNQMIADPAIANTPLFEGTQVVTGDDGRAEIQFEDGSVVRLSPNSTLTLSVLGAGGGSPASEIVLNSGLGYFELQVAGQAGPIRVRFADSVVTAGGFTVLRVNLDNPPGELAVFSGNARLERGSALALDLHGGESVTLNAADPSQYNLAETIEPDSWDTWNSDRDQVLTSQAASRTEATSGFINNNNPAWNDLDANGNWYNVPGEGNIWSPYDAASPGWDPYGNGYWMFTPRFGYMWVSGDTWGYMPFSCGMWNFYSDFGWGWAPGMGACMPWWGGGYYYPNIGFGPIGYRPPVRPRPREPIGRHPIKGGNKFGPYPVIAVNKRPPGGFVGQPVHDRNVPVTIGGHVVQPLRPLSPRPVYDRGTPGYITRSQPPVAGGKAPSGPPSTILFGGGRPGATAPPRPAPGVPVAPRTPAPAPSRPNSPPPSRAPSSGGGGSVPHGGGGGGGGAHPSGGGGSHH